jgi:hypothetical protein
MKSGFDKAIVKSPIMYGRQERRSHQTELDSYLSCVNRA